MVQVSSHTSYYWTKFDKKVAEFNKTSQLPAYFDELIGKKKKVRIAEVGCALVNTIGDTWPTAEIEIACSDKFAHEYQAMWHLKKLEPLHPIEHEDMEALTYPENSFDIVHCRNALDHTPDPLRAIEEMKRVSKEWVYLLHAPNQMSTYGGHHDWDIRLEGDECVFYGKEYSFVLYGFDCYLDQEGLIVCKFKHEV